LGFNLEKTFFAESVTTTKVARNFGNGIKIFETRRALHIKI
jgi:hypothetical protein